MNDQNKRTSSLVYYANFTNKGFQPVNRKEDEAAEVDLKHCSPDIFDFKVIRTPVSCKTYIIGGVTNKVIRQLVFSKSQAYIKPILIPFEVIINMKYDLFSDLSNAVYLRPSTEEDSDKSLKLFDQLYDYVRNKMSCKKWVRSCMNNYSFMNSITSQIEVILAEIDSLKINDYLIKAHYEIISCCYTIMRSHNWIAKDIITECFSLDKFVNTISYRIHQFYCL